MGVVGNQHGIGGFHHNQVVHADHADQFAVGINQIVLRLNGHAVANDGIAVFVFRQRLPHRVPRTQIAPTGIQRHHADGDVGLGAGFHHSIINRFRRDLRKRFGIGADKADVAQLVCAALPPCGAGCFEDVFAELLDGFQPCRCFEDEQAGIPIKAACTQIIFCGGRIGFFHKLRHRINAVFFLRLRLNIAISGFGFVRRYAQNHDAAVFRLAHRPADSLHKRLVIRHQMVGRGDHQYRVVALLCRRQCRQCQRGCRVAGGRFQHDLGLPREGF